MRPPRGAARGRDGVPFRTCAAPPARVLPAHVARSGTPGSHSSRPRHEGNCGSLDLRGSASPWLNRVGHGRCAVVTVGKRGGWDYEGHFDNHLEQRRRDAGPRLRGLPDSCRGDGAGRHRGDCRGLPRARHGCLLRQRRSCRPRHQGERHLARRAVRHDEALG